MTKTLLTYGDSNTYGTPPITQRGTSERLNRGTRWPTVTQATLGQNWTLIEEGLPGRTTAHADPTMGAHMDGQLGLRIALQSHGPIDVLTLMLGTNDLKYQFGLSPDAIAGGIAGLLAIAMGDEMQLRHGGFKTLLICPPPVLEQGPIVDVFFGAHAKSLSLPALYEKLAQHWNIGYFDAGTVIAPSEIDGVHFDAAAHPILGAAVANAITKMF